MVLGRVRNYLAATSIWERMPYSPQGYHLSGNPGMSGGGRGVEQRAQSRRKIMDFDCDSLAVCIVIV